VCAVLSGGQGATHMAAFAVAKEPFLRSFLKLENGLPSHDRDHRETGGQAAMAIGRDESLCGWNLCPYSEPNVPL
jgi:hypothetical protein